jgi:hypothetical protein
MKGNGVFYHCTRNKENLEKIKKEGFTIEMTMDWLKQYLSYEYTGFAKKLGSMLGYDVSNLSEEEIIEHWLNKYGHGTAIWVSEGEPDFSYSKNCLKVDVSPEFLEVFKGGQSNEHYLFWFPQKVIPKGKFTEVDPRKP